MTLTTNTIPMTLIAFAIALVLAVPAAQGGEATGVSIFTPDADSVETGEMTDGSTTEKSMAMGFAVAHDPDSPLHLITQDCSAAWLIAPDGAGRTGKGTCKSIDPEGDQIVFWWKGNQEGGTWGFESGTGKWEGVSGGGTWSAAAMWEDGRYANSWEGKWTGGPEEKEEAPEPAPMQNPLETGGD